MHSTSQTFFSANPNWPEIQDALLEEDLPDPTSNAKRVKQKAYDRPDIVTCVFEQKKNAVIKEIKSGIFSKTVDRKTPLPIPQYH